jgi:hypothetical protein
VVPSKKNSTKEISAVALVGLEGNMVQNAFGTILT